MKTRRFFTLIAAGMAIVACTKPEPTPGKDPGTDPGTDPEPQFTASLKVDKTEKISAEAAGKTAALKVTANISWTATSDQDWVTIEPASETISDQKSKETSVSVTVAANAGTDARTAAITFKAEGCSDIKIDIEQLGVELPDPIFTLFDGDLNPFTGEISATSAAGSTSLFANANVSWTVSSDAEWLTVTPESAEITNYEEIPTAVTLEWGTNFSEERNATVTFQVEGLDPVVVKVNQAAFLQGDFCDIHIQPGSYAANPESNVTNTIALIASGTNVAGIKFNLIESSEIEGTPVETLYAAVTAEGDEFQTAWISYVNDGGLNLSLTGCTPETAYTLIAYATNTAGEAQYIISESSTLGDYIFNDFTVNDEYATITSKESVYGEYLLLAKTTENLSEFTDREAQGNVTFSDGGTTTDEDGYSSDWVNVSGMWNTQFNSKYGLENDVMQFDLSEGFLFLQDSENLGNIVEKASGTPVVSSFMTLSCFEGSNYLFSLYAPVAGAIIDEVGTIAFFDTEFYIDESDSEGNVFGPYLATLLYADDPAQGGWYAAYRDIMFVPLAKATPATISAAKEKASRIQKEIHSMSRNYVELNDSRIERAVRKVNSATKGMYSVAVQR